jgi:hypothetical protein
MGETIDDVCQKSLLGFGNQRSNTCDDIHSRLAELIVNHKV